MREDGGALRGGDGRGVGEVVEFLCLGTVSCLGRYK